MSEATPYLDPLSEALFEAVGVIPTDLPVEEFREEVEKLQQHKELGGVTREKFVVPFEGGVTTWIYKPVGHGREPLPVIFYIHGGAWLAGSIHSHDSIVRDLALRTGFAVVFPEYTLAPDAVYPAQQEECYAVLQWITKNGKKKGLKQDGVALVGDSAGGQLGSAVNILASSRRPKIHIKQNVFISPVADAEATGKETESEFRFFDGPLFTVPLIRRAIKIYIPNEKDRTSELANPRFISDKTAKQFPKTLIITSSADELESEGKLFGEKLQQNGVDCTVLCGEGQLHDTVVFEGTRNGPTPQVLMALIAGQISEALSDKTGKVHKLDNGDEQNGRKRRRRN